MKKAGLIVITGIDGSGKTTQAELLLEILKRDGIQVSYVWSRWKPFFLRPIINKWKGNITKGSTEAKKINELRGEKQKLLSSPIFRWLWLTAFFIDYGLQILIKVRTRLLKKQLVISDRIFYDSVIDQAINLGSGKNGLLESLDSFWVKFLFPEPDIVFYVDCPEDIAFSRKDDAPDIKYLKDRRRLYLELADKYNWKKVDGTLPVEKITEYIKGNTYKDLGLSSGQA